MESTNYEIKLAHFEGPFDLLLFFIERDELNIHDIPISSITVDFLSYIQHMQALNIELASEFIFVAATLMRIKAKMLLPRRDAQEEENEIDLKEDLVQKLVLYKQFKEISEKLKQLEAIRNKKYARGNTATDIKMARKKNNEIEEGLASFDLYKLLLVYQNVINNYQSRTQEEEAKHTVIQYPYTIEQQKKAIADLIEIDKKLDFSSLAKNSENKVQFVYNFLAVLEMLQQKLLNIEIGLGYNNFWIQKN